MVKVGVLALQGAVREHLRVLREIGVEGEAVKRREQLKSLDGLIIPGGESTSIGMLMEEYGIADDLRRGDLPVFGTCAGMILIAKNIENSDQPRLGLIDISVARNAYGRQRESFEAAIEAREVGLDPVHGVFIRAPFATRAGQGVDVLGKLEDHIVLCRQGKMLASSFHPELTDDTRLHRYFVEKVIAGA